MQHDTSLWGTFCLAVAAALALAFLLSGCASSRPAPAAETAADSWGSCDRSRMVRVMLICRQTKTEPVSVLSR
jgi:ABC-type uncharacterized transport system auxiliary subunit